MEQLLVTVTDALGQSQDMTVRASSALIGRGHHCAVQLPGWRVGREHARLSCSAGAVFLEDLGQFSGTWVNGARVGRHGPLSYADQIQIVGFRLRVRVLPAAAPAQFEDPVMPSAPPAFAPQPPPEVRPKAPTGHAERDHWRQSLHEQLLDTIDLRRRDLTRMSDAELRSETEGLLREILDSMPELPAHLDRAALMREVLNEAVGLGPLEDLLADDTVTEIMVNRPDEVFVERQGRLSRLPMSFSSERAVLGIIERIVLPLGRRIDESSPLVDARLKDGSRVNAVIAPLALKGPTLTIRKFARRSLCDEDLVRAGSVSAPMMEFLRLCVQQRKNVVVSGGTGSGKTTFLNVLSAHIPPHERIITIEDAAELRLAQSNLVALEARPANAEGRGAVSIRDLLRNALRMRPDRIVVGECRGGEALDMLQAMNTGHEGSLTTLHANTPRDALARLETLVLMAGMDLPVAAIREQIASAVDIVVQQSRFACGARKLTAVTEVTGMESGKIQMQELFRFEVNGFDAEGRVSGRFRGCRNVPTFCEAWQARGVSLDLGMFDEAGP